MSTFNIARIVRDLVRAGGVFSSDPQAIHISSYVNVNGVTVYHVAYTEQQIGALLSCSAPFVRDVKVLWTLDGGVTLEGQKFLDG